MEFTYEILFENHILYENVISIKIIIIIMISLLRLGQTEQPIKR